MAVAVAVAGLTSGSQVVCAGGVGSCEELGPRPAAGMCGWVRAVVVVAGWVGPTSGPQQECLGAIGGGLGRVVPRTLVSMLRHWWGAELGWMDSPSP